MKNDLDLITRSKGGSGERKEKLSSLKIEDLWRIETSIDSDKKKIIDVWHLAHDLKRELMDRNTEHAALMEVAKVAEMVVEKVNTGRMRSRETYALAKLTLGKLATVRKANLSTLPV